MVIMSSLALDLAHQGGTVGGHTIRHLDRLAIRPLPFPRARERLELFERLLRVGCGKCRGHGENDEQRDCHASHRVAYSLFFLLHPFTSDSEFGVPCTATPPSFKSLCWRFDPACSFVRTRLSTNAFRLFRVRLPEDPVLLQPRIHSLQRSGVELVKTMTSFAPLLHQVGAPQQAANAWRWPAAIPGTPAQSVPRLAAMSAADPAPLCGSGPPGHERRLQPNM